MPKYHTDIEQGTDAWWKLRREIPTASAASKIITKTGKLSASRMPYMHQLYAEAVVPHYAEEENTSLACEWGHQWEPVARKEFAKEHNANVQQVAFVTADNGRAGCSPDGIVGDFEAGLEIKCPFRPANHIATLAAGEMPEEHKPQVHWSLAVTELSCWHFWSYFPGLPPFHQVIERDEYTEKVAEAIKQFGDEYAEFRKMMNEKLNAFGQSSGTD